MTYAAIIVGLVAGMIAFSLPISFGLQIFVGAMYTVAFIFGRAVSGAYDKMSQNDSQA